MGLLTPPMRVLLWPLLRQHVLQRRRSRCGISGLGDILCIYGFLGTVIKRGRHHMLRMWTFQKMNGHLVFKVQTPQIVKK
jgi:hypothetical protein